MKTMTRAQAQFVQDTIDGRVTMGRANGVVVVRDRASNALIPARVELVNRVEGRRWVTVPSYEDVRTGNGPVVIRPTEAGRAALTAFLGR